MVKSLTPRLSLTQWSDPTDPVNRSDFNTSFLNIETWAARDEQGLSSARPAFGIRGRYYFSTDTLSLYRDTGTAWISVGGVVEDAQMTATAAGTSAGVFKAAASQTANIVEIRNSSSVAQSAFDSTGALKAGGTYIAGGGITLAVRRDTSTASINSLTAANPVLVVRGAASQTGDYLRVQNSAGANLALISSAGNGTFNNLTMTTLTPTNDGDVVPRKYLHDNFVSLSGGVINNEVSIAAAADGYVSAPTVGSNLSLRVSRAATKDTVAAKLFSNGSIQVGGLTGAQAGVVPITVGGAASQSVSYVEVKNSGGTVLTKIDQFGALTTKALTVETPSGWTNNALLLKDSAATELFKVDRYGNFAAKNFGTGTTAQRTASSLTTNLAAGAFFSDTTKNQAYFWSGTTWKPIAGREFFMSDNAPTPSDGVDGDVWLEY